MVVSGQAQKALETSPPPSFLDLRAFLPAAGDLQVWEPKPDFQHFKGDDLFLYIDGGAEIYREYGFKQVVVQDYRDKNGRSITLEIFEMDGPESAFGMFTFKSTPKGRPYGIGQEARLDDYYLNFWKGPCLVTLTGFDAGQECVQGLLQIARAVNARMPLKGSRLALMEILPKEWAAASRLIYFRGLLALNNIHTFFPQDVFRFKEGMAAEQDKFKIIILRYATPAEARQRFQAVHAAFAGSSAYKDVKRPMENYFEATDDRGRKLYVQTCDDHISLILTPTATDRWSIAWRISNDFTMLSFRICSGIQLKKAWIPTYVGTTSGFPIPTAAGAPGFARGSTSASKARPLTFVGTSLPLRE